MSEKRKEFTAYLAACTESCREQIKKLSSDGREDEAVFAKIKLNVYDIFKTVFNALGDEEKFLGKLTEIPAAWQASLEKAEAHGDSEKAHIERIKLETVNEIREKFGEA